MFGPTGPTLTEEQRQRYEQDRVTLAQVLPGLRHYIWADGRGAIAEGEVEVDIGAGCWESVEIRMIFDDSYPRVPPRVFYLGQRWNPEDDRHIMANHEFCLWLPNVDTPTVAADGELRKFALRLLPFLRDQFVYDDLGRWPGRDWRHGRRAAYAQHLIETLNITDAVTFRRLWPLLLGSTLASERACPCGSQLPYLRCHRPVVERLQWVRKLGERHRLPHAVEEQLDEAA
jgi:hypothetical protein